MLVDVPLIPWHHWFMWCHQQLRSTPWYKLVSCPQNTKQTPLPLPGGVWAHVLCWSPCHLHTLYDIPPHLIDPDTCYCMILWSLLTVPHECPWHSHCHSYWSCCMALWFSPQISSIWHHHCAILCCVPCVFSAVFPRGTCSLLRASIMSPSCARVHVVSAIFSQYALIINVHADDIWWSVMVCWSATEHEYPPVGRIAAVRLCCASCHFLPHRGTPGSLHDCYSQPPHCACAANFNQPVQHWSQCLWWWEWELFLPAKEDVPVWVKRAKASRRCG